MNNLNSYWQSRLTKNFSLAGVGFEGVGVGYNLWLYKLRARYFRRIIKDHFGDKIKSTRTIDVGTGTGFYLKLLQDLNVNELTAIDFNSVSAIKLPQQFPLVSFHNMDISDELPTQLSDSFDLVVCIDVLFHIVDKHHYDRVIQNLFRLLRQGGMLIVTENLAQFRSERGHVVDRTEEEILYQFKQTGFEILEEIPAFIVSNKPLKSNSKILWRFSDWRIRFLKQNNERGLDKVNYLFGMVLYLFEILGDIFSVEGKGTSFIVFSKSKRFYKYINFF